MKSKAASGSESRGLASWLRPSVPHSPSSFCMLVQGILNWEVGLNVSLIDSNLFLIWSFHDYSTCNPDFKENIKNIQGVCSLPWLWQCFWNAKVIRGKTDVGSLCSLRPHCLGPVWLWQDKQHNTFSDLFVVYVCRHSQNTYVEVRGQLEWVGFLLPPHRTWGLNSGH